VAPMMAFPSDDGRTLTFALTYGAEAEWVRNTVASGSAVFDSRWTGRVRLVEPRVVHDPQRRAMPWLVRQVLGVMRVDDVLVATVAGPSETVGAELHAVPTDGRSATRSG
ncbi:MAG TPA: hypothetical protein VGO64_07955, partial [Candidatus Limnocylindrales bacterium]|nr:hypothetical protein [Candidatus Limnocylindrales bacterium]